MYSYVWKKDGTVLGSATTSALTSLTQGIYACTITSGSYSAILSIPIVTGIVFTPTPLAVTLNWPPVSGASGYRVQSSKTSASATDFLTVQDTKSLTIMTVSGLTAGTTYYFRVLSCAAAAPKAFVQKFSGSVTLPANTVQAFTKSSIPASTYSSAAPTIYDITGVHTADGVTADSVVNSVFSSGDTVKVNCKKGTVSTTQSAQIVTPGSTSSVALAKNTPLYTPVVTAGQVSTLKLSDNSTVAVTVNSTSVTVGGTVYSAGTTFILGGQRCTVSTV